MTAKERRSRRVSPRSARSSSPTAAASTARTSPASRTERLGDRALAVTADSPSYPERHRAARASTSRGEFGLRHEIIHTSELERPEYRANPANRCYFCKHELYTHLSRIAAARGASSSTATTPTIAATIGRAGRRRASSACAARSTKST